MDKNKLKKYIVVGVVLVLITIIIILLQILLSSNKEDKKLELEIDAPARFYVYEKDKITARLKNMNVTANYTITADDSNIYDITTNKELKTDEAVIEVDPFEIGNAKITINANYNSKEVNEEQDILICKPMNQETIRIKELTVKKGDIITVPVELGNDDCNKIKMSTSNKNMMIKDLDGNYIANEVGTTNLIINDGRKAYTISLTINPSSNIEPTKISFEQEEYKIKLNSTEKLNIIQTPTDSTQKELIFKTSDDEIASVAKDGTVTAKKLGNVTITAITKDKKLEAKTTIIVTGSTDTKIPKAKSVIMKSNNESKYYAKQGDKITLSIEFNQEVTTPRVTISGVQATVVKDNNHYIAYVFVNKDMPDGVVKFSIEGYKNNTLREGVRITNVTSGSKVIIDNTIPTCELKSVNGELTMQYQDNNKITEYTINTDENVEKYDNSKHKTVTAPGIYYGHVKDVAGNKGICKVEFREA